MFDRIERGATVRTQDGEFGRVYQVIVDPETNDLTHVVVRPTSGGDDLMIPASMIAQADGGQVTLNSNRSSLLGMASQLRYDESEFQPVDPDSVEGRAHAPTGQTVTAADNDTLSFGGSTSSGTISSAPVGASMGTATVSSGADASSTSTSSTGPVGTGAQRKGSDFVGLPVISFAEGEQIGKVQDILFDPEENRIIAIVTEEGGWFSSARVVPWRNIRTVGPDSIIVPDHGAEIKADSDEYIRRVLESDNILKNTQVYSEDGRDLGKIQDMYVDDTSGEVVGYEVSGGIFNATLRGKKFMPAPETLTVGQDVAFVPDEVADAMQQQTGGLTGATQSVTSTASEKLTQASSAVSETTRQQQRSFVLGKTTNSDVTADTGEVLVPAGKVIDASDLDRADSVGKLNTLFLAAGGSAASGLLDTVKAKTSDLTDQASSTLNERREQQLRQSIGSTVSRDVYADDGSAIAMSGSVVTPLTVERARSYGKENQLLAAVGASSAQETLGQAREGIAGALSGVTARIDEFRSDLQERSEQKRINNALGRPVTRVILDRNDNVILETAQIVTNQAIEQARLAGVLDILLDSVATDDIELSPEAYHSGASGTAALPPAFEQQRKPTDPIT